MFQKEYSGSTVESRKWVWEQGDNQDDHLKDCHSPRKIEQSLN